MRFIFFCVFGILFIILTILLVVLLKKKIFNKYDVLKYMIIFVPVLCVTLALVPFAYLDYAHGYYPFNKEWVTFVGKYDYDDSYGSIELFKYKVADYDTGYHRYPRDGTYHPVTFKVKNRADFEKYLETVPYFSEKTTFADGGSLITFKYNDRIWQLINNGGSSLSYSWYAYAEGSKVYETKFRAKDRDRYFQIFSYHTVGEEYYGEENGYTLFNVADEDAFETYLTTVDIYAGTDTDADGKQYFRFVDGEKMWSLEKVNRSGYTYLWSIYAEQINIMS